MQLKDLHPHPKNPRKVTTSKLDLLRKSLSTHGDTSGIVFNRRTNRLAGGHQRVKVLPPESEIEIVKKFDPPTPAGTVAIGLVWIDGEPYPYREIDVDEDRELAAMIAANKGAGEWDFILLNDQLLHLDHKNCDLGLTMFDENDLANTLAPTTPPRRRSMEVTCPKCGEIFQQKQNKGKYK